MVIRMMVNCEKYAKFASINIYNAFYHIQAKSIMWGMLQ